MPRNGDEEGPAPESSGSGSRLRARPDAFLVVCWCFSLVTVLAAILCIVVNVVSAVRSFKDGSDVFDGIFRCYAVVIGLLVILAETEWSLIIRFWKVLEYWAGRGMLHIFVAVMTKAYYSESQRNLVLLQGIASYALLACGLVYIISGILCIGLLKRRHQQKETTRDQAIKDLEELEQRREELEQLLLQDTA